MTNGFADLLPQRFQSQEEGCSLTLPEAVEHVEKDCA